MPGGKVSGKRDLWPRGEIRYPFQTAVHAEKDRLHAADVHNLPEQVVIAADGSTVLNITSTTGWLAYEYTIPADGTHPEVDVEGLHIRVERMEGHRVETALVSLLDPPGEEEPAEA